MIRSIITFLFMVFLALPAFAVEPDEMLDDPVLEQRARDLSVNLRCLVCQNQSIDDSDAKLAKDLRVLIRERLVKGDSDKEAIDFVVAKYGEFVLLKPRFGMHTLFLWLGPFAILLLGAVALFLSRKNKNQTAPVESGLSEEEQKRLDEILKK